MALLPLDALKIKAQTNEQFRKTATRSFSGLSSAVRAEGGVAGLYSGWQWTLLRNVPGSFARFVRRRIMCYCAVHRKNLIP